MNLKNRIINILQHTNVKHVTQMHLAFINAVNK